MHDEFLISLVQITYMCLEIIAISFIFGVILAKRTYDRTSRSGLCTAYIHRTAHVLVPSLPHRLASYVQRASATASSSKIHFLTMRFFKLDLILGLSYSISEDITFKRLLSVGTFKKIFCQILTFLIFLIFLWHDANGPWR